MNERSNSEVSLGRVPPVWVPDSYSSFCQECHVKFTFIIRKHHCRACGRLLCSYCSRFQEPLEYLGWNPSRVCGVCHENFHKPKPREDRPRRIRKTKSLNDFDELKENISRLIRSQKIAEVESSSLPIMSTCPDFLSILPLELLTRILEFLPFEDLKFCRLVSRHWLQAVSSTHYHQRCLIRIGDEADRKEEILGRYENIIDRYYEHFFLQNFPFDSKFPVLMMGEMCSNIQSLIFYECEISPSGLIAILNNISELRVLGLINCKQLFMTGTFLNSSEDRDLLTSKLGQLRELFLDNNSYLSDILLLRLTNTLTNLENCNLMSHSQGVVTRIYPQESEDTPASSSVITWRIVVRIIQKFEDTLKSLNISRNTGVKIEDLCEVTRLKLHNLNITGCSSVSNEGFQSFIQIQNELTVLKVDNCRKILAGTKEQTRDIFQYLKNVELLNISENSVAHLGAMSALSRLLDLTMDNLDSSGSSITSAMTSLDVSHLVSWRARGLSMSSQDLVKIYNQQNFTKLTKLDISRGREDVITNSVFSAICTNLINLQYLDVSGNLAISDAGTLNLAEQSLTDGFIFLGSRAEHDIVEASKKQNLYVDYLMKQLNKESKLAKAEEEKDLIKLTNLKKLTHLDLSGTSISSLTLSHGLDSPNLRYLGVSDCRGGLISDQGLQELTKTHRSISHLTVASSCITDLSLISCVSRLSRLEYLDIRKCVQVTSGSLPALAQIAPQLKTLLLSGCPGITPDMLRYAKSYFYGLKKIDI